MSLRLRWTSRRDSYSLQQWIRNWMPPQQSTCPVPFLSVWLTSLLLSGVFCYTHKLADDKLPHRCWLLAAFCKPQRALPGETTCKYDCEFCVRYVNGYKLLPTCNIRITVAWSSNTVIPDKVNIGHRIYKEIFSRLFGLGTVNALFVSTAVAAILMFSRSI